jgi:ABC-type multidrug transport system fused ATPase/permease subunit
VELLALIRRLASPAVARRAAVISGLVLVERLAIPAAAWAVFHRPFVEQAALALGLGAVLSARTFAQHAFRARTEAELLGRVVASLVGGDVLRTNVLPDEDARAELAQAVYHATQGLAAEVPFLVADGAAAVLLGGAIALREPWPVAAVALAVTGLAAAGLLASRRALGNSIAVVWGAQQRVHDGLVDAIEGRLDVVAWGRRAAFLDDIRDRGLAWAAAGDRLAVEALVTNRLPVLAIGGLVAAGVALVGARWPHAVGTSAAEIALLASVSPAFAGLAQHAVALTRAKRWLGVVARALAEPRLSSGGAQGPPALPASIELHRVTFAYPGAASPALRDVSFAWDRGVLAIAGANGSGKSTCLRVLLALARPQSGAVSIAGAPLDDLDADAWRGKVAFLPQRPYFPPRSDVRGALSFLVPDVSDGDYLAALGRVGLLPVLERAGKEPLAVRVDTLSVGGRQRVGLARILCRKASLFVLDEPDANLDRAGIAFVADLIRELGRDAMVVVVAHSLELIEAADRVIHLDGGRVVRDETVPRASRASRA